MPKGHLMVIDPGVLTRYCMSMSHMNDVEGRPGKSCMQKKAQKARRYPDYELFD